MQGYLKMITGFFSLFQERYYFILNDCKLIYCQDKNKPKLGQIHLHYAKIEAIDNNPLRFKIVSDKQYLLQAPQQPLCNQWIDSINLQIADSHIDNKKAKSIKGGNQKLDTVIAEIWSLQAEMQENIEVLKSRRPLQDIEIRYLNRISKISQQLKDKVYHIKKIIQRQDIFDLKLSNKNSQENKRFRDDDDLMFEDFEEKFEQTQFQSFIDNYQSSVSQITPKQQPVMEINVYLGLVKIIHPLKSVPIPQRNQSFTTTYLKSHPIFQTQASGNNYPLNSNIHSMQMCLKYQSLPFLMNQTGSKFQVAINLIVNLNQPLTTLQKLAEPFLYKYLIDKANIQNQSTLRLAYVAAYQVSKLSFLISRYMKPFNPLLGQTYQLITDQFFFLSEYVNSNPSICVSYGQSKHFKMSDTLCLTFSLWSGSLKISQQYPSKINLKKYNDFIESYKPVLYLRGLLVGPPYIEINRTIRLQNEVTKDEAIINFQSGGLLGKLNYNISGHIINGQGLKKYKIQGAWNKEFTIVDVNTQEKKTLWTISSQIPGNQKQYYMGPWLKQLNFLNVQLLKKIAPTDSRLRPDIRALEHGFFQLAQRERARLQELQKHIKKLEKEKRNHIPRWFDVKKNQKNKMVQWNYLGGYMQARKKQNFENILQIF